MTRTRAVLTIVGWESLLDQKAFHGYGSSISMMSIELLNRTPAHLAQIYLSRCEVIEDISLRVKGRHTE